MTNKNFSWTTWMWLFCLPILWQIWQIQYTIIVQMVICQYDDGIFFILASVSNKHAPLHLEVILHLCGKNIYGIMLVCCDTSFDFNKKKKLHLFSIWTLNFIILKTNCLALPKECCVAFTFLLLIHVSILFRTTYSVQFTTDRQWVPSVFALISDIKRHN